jgi:nucleoside-diphosphate-sugar epimerase
VKTSARCLVTGATGFTGSQLAKRLVSDGCEVHAIVRTASSLSRLESIHGRIVIHVTDGSAAAMIRILHEVKADIVFHLASLFRAEHAPADVDALVDSNVKFTAQLLEGMLSAGTANLVNAGTSWQHFHSDGYDPVCLYAATKQSAQDLISFYVRAKAMRCITLKLFDIYGPDDPRKKLLHAFQLAAASNVPVPFSKGEQIVDLVFVDDVVNAFAVAADRVKTIAAGSIEEYGVSSGEPLRLRDLAAMYETATGRKLNIDWGARPYRAREVMAPWANYAKLPGWEPRVGLADGLRIASAAAI